MVEHLHQLGHRELLLVSQPRHVVDRGGAYVLQFQDAACEYATSLGMTMQTVFGEAGQPAVGASLHRLLDAHPQVTAIMVNNEAVAAALPMVLHARGIRVPEDLSVIGRYSEQFARHFSLPFSFVESAPDRLGALAVRQLVRRVESAGADQEPHAVRLLAPDLVDRGSTAAARSRTTASRLTA